MHVAVVVGHVSHVDVVNQAVLLFLRVLFHHDEHGVAPLEAAVGQQQRVLSVVHVAVVDGCLAHVLSVDDDIGVCNRAGDGGIASRTDIEQHLVGAATFDGDGVGVVAEHAEVLVTDGQLLGIAWHINPDFSGFVLRAYDSERTAVEIETVFHSDDLNQRGSLAVLVHIGCAMRGGGQVCFEHTESEYRHLLSRQP